MSESRKTPTGIRSTNTTAETNSTRESSLTNNNENSDDDNGNNVINENFERFDLRSLPIPPSTTGPSREHPDEEGFECRPANPPKRNNSSSERHQSMYSSPSRKKYSTDISSYSTKNKVGSTSREKSILPSQMNTTNDDATSEGEKATLGQTFNVMEVCLDSSERARKQQLDNNSFKYRQRKNTSSLEKRATDKLAARNAIHMDPSSCNNSRAERYNEKTHVTTRTASSSNSGHASLRCSISDNNKINYDDDTDNSLSTAPGPPSLRVRDHYSLRPGAYRMSTGGIARFVNSANDDIDNYSNNFDDTGFDSNIDTVALDASLVEDEPLPSPPLYRPTTSEAYTFSTQRSYDCDRAISHSIQENTECHRDGHRRTDQSIEGVTSTSPTTAAYTARTTMDVDEYSSFDKDDIDEIKYFNKQNKLIVVGLVVFFVLTLASMGAVYAITVFNKKNPESNQNVETNDEIQGLDDDQSLSLPPTKPPSISSSAIALESFIKVLPDYTKKSLQVENSPQSKAIIWLSTYDDIELYILPRQLQRFALISLYFSITSKVPSHETLTWFAGLDECIWYDSKCVDNVYIELSLQSNHTLRGTIIPELSLLSSLERLLIDQNALVGVIPTELGQITTLKEIRINGNLFRGTIPTEFGKLSYLEDIDLGNNLLSGSIPTEIGSWNKVQTLMLANNSLAGTIPSEIGSMSELVSLSASSNKLVGELPSEIGQLKRIKIFDAEKNYLNGEFVSKFENLGYTLQNLQLRSNEFSGTLSSTIGLLTNLVELDVSENRLKGSLPTEIGLMTSLTRLQLYSNAFDDMIPSELGLLQNAESMALHDNLFTGTVPIIICELTYTCALLREELTVDCKDLFCVCCSCPPK